MLELVILDCDGVLVDSEPLSNHALAEALTAIGLPCTAEDCVRDFLGRSIASVHDEVARRLGRPAPDGFEADFRARAQAAFSRALEPVPGVAAALDRIATPTCVASSGPHAKIRFTLGHTRLLERFEGRIFSATEVARGKPAPDLFLHAAERMGADPARCAVVEDSPVGVAAAQAARMRALGFAGRTPASALAGARTFADMAELPELLAELGAAVSYS